MAEKRIGIEKRFMLSKKKFFKGTIRQLQSLLEIVPEGSLRISKMDAMIVPLSIETLKTFIKRNMNILSNCLSPFKDQVKDPSKKPSPVKSGGRRLAIITKIIGRT
jgi:hypothetical protein